MLRISVLGAGSIGCYLGGHLQNAGQRVTFIGRNRVKWGTDLKGMALTHYKRPPITIPVGELDYVLDYKSLSQADIILVCVKAQDSVEAAQLIMHNAAPNTLVISFQNGINNQGIIERASAQRVLGGVVPFNVTQSRAGQFHSGTEGDLIIEASDDVRLKKLIKAFRKSGMGVKTTEDIASVQWGKLLVNLNNALSALSGDTLHKGLSQRDYREFLAAMMEEGLKVCRGAGIEPQTFGRASISKTISILRLPNFLFKPVMNNVLKIDKSARSSMLDDLEAGKPSEIEYLQGEIIRLAERVHQSAMLNNLIRREVIRAFDAGKSPYLSGKDIMGLLTTI